MAIRRTKALAIAAGSAGSAVGSGVSEDIVQGVVHGVYREYLLRLAFTSGSVEPQPAQTLSGATSAATGFVIHVVLTSGTWAVGDAAGNIYIVSQTGTFAAENLDNDSTGAANIATIAADSVAVVNTTDVTVIGNNDYALNGPAVPILTVSNSNTSGWNYPRTPTHAVADGSELAGQADYQSINDYVKLSLAGANPADAVRIIVDWDNERG